MFENLKKLEVRADQTADFVIYQVEGEPVLKLAPATEANKPYFNALLKRSRKNQRRLQSGNFTATMIQENRDNDRELYPLFVIKGWNKVVDAGGKAVEPTRENFKAFLDALPDWLFEEVRNFATDPQSFIDNEVDVEDVAGNLR